MLSFLLTFFLIYGGMQAYIWWWIRRAVPGSNRFLLWSSVFLFIMLLAPILVVQLDGQGMYGLARGLALVGYSWMAVSLWFCVVGAVLDLWNGAAWGLGWAGIQRCPRIRTSHGILAITMLILCAVAWGRYEAASIRVVEHRLELPDLQPGSPPVRLVQLSDLHLGLIHRRKKLHEVLNLVKKTDPDILVCTGDMVDASFHHLRAAADLFAKCDPPLGKYAVTGNHEYYAGMESSLKFFDKAGFRVLRGDSVTLDGRFNMAGVDDPAGRWTGQSVSMDENDVLNPSNTVRPTVLLKHRPRVAPETVGQFALQLSGHSHGGQIFPFTLMADAYHRFDPGLHQLSSGDHVYVTTGTGTWGPPFRVGSPPEIVIFVLEPPAS